MRTEHHATIVHLETSADPNRPDSELAALNHRFADGWSISRTFERCDGTMLIIWERTRDRMATYANLRKAAAPASQPSPAAAPAKPAAKTSPDAWAELYHTARSIRDPELCQTALSYLDAAVTSLAQREANPPPVTNAAAPEPAPAPTGKHLLTVGTLSKLLLELAEKLAALECK